MTVTFRPAKREHQPLVIGLAGPSKSGKSLSALRLAVGLAGGGRILMVNTEPHGHHYADQFTYEAIDIESPHRIEKYVEAIDVVAKEQPAVLIIDTLTHSWDGIGGMKETKDELALKMAKGDPARAEKMSAPAWAKVKADENHFIYRMLELRCHIILCFRAKDKMHIPKGGGEWTVIPMQPIMSDRIAFETLFTLTFPAHARGVPDLSISDLRWPFDTMIPKGAQIDEGLGEELAAWAKGAPTSTASNSHALPPEAVNPGAPSGSSGRVPWRENPILTYTVERPPRTPVDDWEDELDHVNTPPQRNTLWESRIKPNWGSLLGVEQKRLLVANDRARSRVGG